MPCQSIFRFWHHVRKLYRFGKIGEAWVNKRNLAIFMKRVNVHPCLEHILQTYRACHKATEHASIDYYFQNGGQIRGRHV